MSIRGKAIIAGVGLAGIGRAPGYEAVELLAQASSKALADAGLTMKDVDGLFVAQVARHMPTLEVAEYLGIDPPVNVGTNMGGNSAIDHVLWAAMALDAGLCNVALVAYGNNPRSKPAFSGPFDTTTHETRYHPRDPISSYALAAARHMYEYGTTREQLAAVAVASREWATHNPLATKRERITVADVLASRMLADPITVLDCCLVTDGAGAIVMTRPDRAKDLDHDAVYVLGVGTGQTHRHISQMPDLTQTGAVTSGRRAFEMAKLTPEDVDVLQLYDAFTINVLLFLENLGFVKPGESGAFVESGAIAPGGSLPVNTNGGGLSFCHSGMYGIFTLVEAVQQLRGDAPGLQLDSPTVALCHGNGGVLSAESTAILGTEATL